MWSKVTGLLRGNLGSFWRVGIWLAFALLPQGAAQLLPTKTTLVSSPNPSVLGQTVTLTATVSPVVAPAPVSKVTFYDGLTVLGIGTLTDGKATLTTALLLSGSHSLRAYYSGDTLFLTASTSASVTQRVVALPQNGFLPAKNYKAGTTPAHVAVGDFNGDGKADLAVANSGSGKVSVLLGNGTGSFPALVDYDAGFIPVSVAVGDFNGDGIADLAVANLENVSVLLGKGDGTFQPKVNYDAGIFPASVAVGDFNGDGIADLAVANLISNDVSVLLGAVRGGFLPAVNYVVGSSPSFVTVGDFNGDGKADLAVTNVDSADAGVLLGKGDGTFRRVSSYAVGDFPGPVAVGNFNGDGKADFAVTGGGVVNVLLGNGDGTFLAPVIYYAGADPAAVAVGDFNADGKTDLAVTNSSGDNVSVLLGNGDGTFQEAVNYGVGTKPGPLVVGDLNGDGKTDLAVANTTTNDVSILLGLGTPFPDLTITKTHVGNFHQGQTGASYSITVSNLLNVSTKGAVTVSDTLPAGLTATAISGTGWSCTLKTLICTRSDALEAFAKYPTITLTVSVASNATASVTNTATVSGGGDLNFANNTTGDPTTILHQMTTLALAHSPNPSVFGKAVTLTATVSPAEATGTVTFYDGAAILGLRTLSGGKATLTTALLPSGSRSLRAYYGGDSTFAASASAAVAHTVAALPQNGFHPAVSYNAGPFPYSIAVGDFNRDGKVDLAVASGRVVRVLLGNGDGTFQAAADYSMGNALSLAVGDFNGDGKADLAVANLGDFSVLLGNGDGTFQPAVNYNARSDPQSVVVGDFNGDGIADLAGTASVLLGNGDGTFRPAINYNAGSTPQSVAVGDFNGDGKADLAVANALSNNVSVLLGNGDGTFRPAVNYNAASGPQSVAVGDFNGDGNADLAVVNALSNNVSILLGTGDGFFLPAVHYNAGSGPQSVAVGDFNGDGKADLALANALSNNVSVLLGNGDGTFQAAVNYNAGSPPRFVAVGDFNGDGVSDLAVANTINTVTILLGMAVPIPDLTITKTHAGSFARGQTGAIFTITVSNNGAGPTTGTVTVADTLPAGLTATAMSGAGWTCALATLSCTRSDVLAAGASYSPITLTVNVAGTAAASITNTATVSGGGELNTANNTASDPATVVQVADLTITKTHAGSFAQGQTGATFSITVSNNGAGPTAGTVTATDTLPAGLTAAAMSGAGWTCALATLSCTRSDALEAGASYPPIILTVNVAGSAAASLTNRATVGGGGELNTANNTALDPTTVLQTPVVNAAGIVNGASFSTDGLVSPGSLVSLFGLSLAADTALANEIPLPRALAGAQVLVNDTAAPLFYVSPSQINFQMPAEAMGDEASVVVTSAGLRSLSATAKIVPQAPGIFSAQPGGTGQGAVLNQDFSPNSAQNPAPRGSVIQIFATGLGATNPPLASGQPGAQAEPFNRTFAIPAVFVGGFLAGFVFSAVAPGFVGLYQINARIPAGAPSGVAVSLQIVAGGRASNTVTIALQ